MTALPPRYRWALSAWNNRRNLILAVTCAIAAVAGLFAMAPSATNCGGNSDALAHVHGIAGLIRMFLVQNANTELRLTSPPDDLRPDLAELSHFYGLPNARFLVTTTPITARDLEQPRLVTVCDHSYRNVPQRWFGLQAPPTHAAGYSDGATGLISEAQFAALDHSTFVPLDELFPAKPK
jgi:hypothetical protein